ncbi:MAG: hypothetical protein QW186_02770 [Candidatus Bathyarchaeia archaeon]
MKILSAVILLMALSITMQQEFYMIERCIITVYRDGVAHVYIEAYADETEPYVVLPLLSSAEKISNIIALDENNEVLDYDYGENNTIIIYSLGAKQVKLEYETTGLTSMEYGLWTLEVTAPFNLKVRLPENATILYLSGPPDEIRFIEGRVELTLYPGRWEISYEVPVKTPEPSQPPIAPPPKPLNYLTLTYYVIAGACIACAAALTAIYIKRWGATRGLSKEEMEVVKYIRERGGRALEAELRERFPHIPRTSMWRLIRRLEKMGIVQVRRVGLQNVVELK